ncbi:hypothetical protein DAPPUDRAFT_248686 [Daphnia pulex]|uniref:Uncharacterized protein n=1 Tax=Daphnia pulex TaxID=6669 RepID=E9GV09_DAPPU|nr:hypothetical protein DAPPUDRAFT_248686 [Daphnia pulex]|eukprot:EFX76584.1 hypothetical protein DAPPUDRAFT_248686 [Daphnia pulex]
MAENDVQDNQPLRAIAHLPKFDGTNHREWNFEIDLVFQHHDLKDVVLGNEVLPEELYRSISTCLIKCSMQFEECDCRMDNPLNQNTQHFAFSLNASAFMLLISLLHCSH